jgi:hypothetical protein
MTKNGNKQLISLCLCAIFLSLACGAGPYGFSRYYQPSDSEKPYHEKAIDIPYGVVAARPYDYKDSLIAWFGIVEKIEPMKDGRFMVSLSHHRHKDRHLCYDEPQSSCRVTVHFKSSGEFSAALFLKPEDIVPGLDRVQPGTLMRVFGKVRCWEEAKGNQKCNFDDKGGVMLEGVYYRQWPARYYATTRAASGMRR